MYNVECSLQLHVLKYKKRCGPKTKTENDANQTTVTLEEYIRTCMDQGYVCSSSGEK